MSLRYYNYEKKVKGFFAGHLNSFRRNLFVHCRTHFLTLFSFFYSSIALSITSKPSLHDFSPLVWLFVFFFSSIHSRLVFVVLSLNSVLHVFFKKSWIDTSRRHFSFVYLILSLVAVYLTQRKMHLRNFPDQFFQLFFFCDTKTDWNLIALKWEILNKLK